MKRIDKTVIRETLYIFLLTVILSTLMEAVFLCFGKWSVWVLLGNLIGVFAATGNFFLMGLTVQSALGKEEKDAKNLMRVSQGARFFLLFAVALAGWLIWKDVFVLLSVVITFLFPRIAVMLRPLGDKIKK